MDLIAVKQEDLVLASLRTGLTLCRESFKWCGLGYYENIQASLRNVTSIRLFKKELDSWVKSAAEKHCTDLHS